MGLDMWLDGFKILNKNEKKIMIRPSEMYWRKANAIHKWFVDNVQDGKDNCLPHRCEINTLIELRDVCEQVLNSPYEAEELLPVYEGFFFGSYEYSRNWICRITSCS